ncbi:transcriptional regulator (Cti6), putative [Paecilomyces variotii No. 5]|uniref:Transcriptional regulator (Cti6), putative n=1 Tax=Byssochlamys spectabilis (strain No. 5 / NBRC 109023) TaxID=1356009 RepID=V5I3G7_BYSSN|nr:transcriptional regulator (Cti6), putative [Paecilomyces variotii No. 5]
MSPRRSSRARTTQPSPALLQHTNSSSSSNSLTRGERSTRSNNKTSPQRRGSAQRSQSSDDPDTSSKNEFPQTRQRQRAREDDNEEALKFSGEEDEDGEEEEITRCLCGQQEYPGLPPSRREALGRAGLNPGVKDESGLNSSADSSDLLNDEIGSMFIQCDSCKVWQHGGCVGIMDEAMSPDEYFCEECRADLHKITNEPNGNRSSSYLPVAPVSSPPSSRASSRDNTRRTKEPKNRQNDNASTKRRSTMNSRDAAYDEEEQLRRAIEESKEETRATNEEVSNRRGKRSRSDSEAVKQVVKRQRTASPSPSALSKQSNSASQPPSDDESKKANANGAKKRKGSTSRSQHERDTKEPEETSEAGPAESNRRKGRSDRRKGDTESDQEAGSPAKAAPPPAPEPPQPAPVTPVLNQEPIAPRPSTRKTGRPSRRGGRLGRNQYTRDRDLNGFDTNHSPRRGQSHDTGGDSPREHANGVHTNGGESGKPSRPRYMNPHRTTMNDMKRRVAAILEFISRMQVEMAVNGESITPPENGGAASSLANSKALAKSVGAHLETLMQATNGEEGEDGTPSAPPTESEGGSEQAPKEKDFKDLSSVEMMDVLTRHLLKWQQEYGKYGEK